MVFKSSFFQKNSANEISFFLMLNLVLYLIFFSCSTERSSNVGKTELRPYFKTLSIVEAKMMIKGKGFFDKYWNKSGSFDNQYESKKIKNEKIVIDHATGLIWHQSGSMDFLNLTEAGEWLDELNVSKYAGINTWRLPTLEEALSLLENKKMNGNLYIAPLFNSWQWCILTGDSLDSTISWLVAFSGRVDWFNSEVRINYVRPVSSFLK